jgi:hypothetical protein
MHAAQWWESGPGFSLFILLRLLKGLMLKMRDGVVSPKSVLWKKTTAAAAATQVGSAVE